MSLQHKDGYIFIAIKRGMYKIPQSVLFAQELLEKRVGKRVYYQSEYTPGLWLPKTRSITISLCLDDFGVKYVKEEDKKHLLYSLNQYYNFDVDKEGT